MVRYEDSQIYFPQFLLCSVCNSVEKVKKGRDEYPLHEGFISLMYKRALNNTLVANLLPPNDPDMQCMEHVQRVEHVMQDGPSPLVEDSAGPSHSPKFAKRKPSQSQLRGEQVAKQLR